MPVRIHIITILSVMCVYNNMHITYMFFYVSIPFKCDSVKGASVIKCA